MLTETDVLVMQKHFDAIHDASEAIIKWAHHKLDRDYYERGEGDPGATADDIIGALDLPEHGDALWHRCMSLAHQMAYESGNMPAHGEENRRSKKKRRGQGKLTAADARAIYIAAQQPGVTQNEVADEYGVSNSTVSEIVLRKTWKNVTADLAYEGAA